MAPKGKAPPKDTKKKDVAEEGKKSCIDTLKNPKVAWPIIGVTALVLLIILITLIYFYTSLEVDKPTPYDTQMQKLKFTMATGLRSPKLNYENPRKVTDEVVKLPLHISSAQKSHGEMKQDYQALFVKGVKSTGGWQHFGKSVYYVSKGEKSWYAAENFCMSRDAHLASILSDEEQDFITSQLDEPAWIGLTDENEEGNWEWTDGSRLEAEFWSEGKPSLSVQYGAIENDCISIVPSPSGSNWMDANCHDHKRWVCKESQDVREP